MVSSTGRYRLGYETPGYGYGQKDAEGTPLLQKELAKLAGEYDIPYVIEKSLRSWTRRSAKV